MKQQRGFTLIELVMVIVILGILAAVAIPKFIDLKADAATAGNQGVAGSLASASAINFASQQLPTPKGTAGLLACSSFGVLLADGAVPAGYTVSGTGPASAGATATCSVTNTAGGSAASFTAIGS